VKVLLLGAGEFFAPFIAEALAAARQEVAVLTRCKFDFGESVRSLREDPADAAAIAAAVRSWRPDAVIDMLHDTPAHAQAVLAACAGKVTRSVHLSSGAVYGPDPICPVDEEADLVRPDTAPAPIAALAEADQVVLSAIEEGAPAVILRLPELYGPRDPRCAEWFFARRALDGRPHIAVPDAGLAICHRGFVQNMARGVAKAVTAARAPGQVFNLGEEKLYTLAQLARGVARAMDHEWDIFSVPGHRWRTPYDRTVFFDLRKARGRLRYRDRMIPRDGLELTLAWLCQQPRGDEWTWPGIEEPFNYPREDELIEAHGRKLEC